MATAIKRLHFQAWNSAHRATFRTRPAVQAQWQRPLSSTPVRFADDNPRRDLPGAHEESQFHQKPANLENAPAAASENMDGEKALAEIERTGESGARQLKTVEGWDEEFESDDITSLGHGELEQHREIREFMRYAAWELPLLSKLATPFEPPTASAPLHFRYTTYLGESHPAETKVVLQFSPLDLPDLSPQQRDKLIKLAGVRYNPSKRLVRMSSESFSTVAQNKRFLAEQVEALIAEAKNAKDMFEDVPFDFRHHTSRPRLRFPEKWKMTADRKARLEEERMKAIEAEREKTRGRLVDGEEAVRVALPLPKAQEEAVPMLVGLGRHRRHRRH
ncbi:hypothetical protein LTS18_004368 [Coniosporium uncinatum]|uniref:Uncharacterized protein n=1 Tax=Coniosporium uncinatum TaxID=93489 RepID=A0ACC3DBB2_9PEZI|nr:hypothetical protein LTS18_004368 [Coniosporium uncinatum]